MRADAVYYVLDWTEIYQLPVRACSELRLTLWGCILRRYTATIRLGQTMNWLVVTTLSATFITLEYSVRHRLGMLESLLSQQLGVHACSRRTSDLLNHQVLQCWAVSNHQLLLSMQPSTAWDFSSVDMMLAVHQIAHNLLKHVIPNSLCTDLPGRVSQSICKISLTPLLSRKDRPLQSLLTAMSMIEQLRNAINSNTPIRSRARFLLMDKTNYSGTAQPLSGGVSQVPLLRKGTKRSLADHQVIFSHNSASLLSWKNSLQTSLLLMTCQQDPFSRIKRELGGLKICTRSSLSV